MRKKHLGVGALVALLLLATLLAGNFTAKLTVTDPHGATHTVSQTLVIEAPGFAPLTAEIEPPDGTAVRGTVAWVRWAAPPKAKGSILWRKEKEPAFQTVQAGAGE